MFIKVKELLGDALFYFVFPDFIDIMPIDGVIPIDNGENNDI